VVYKKVSKAFTESTQIQEIESKLKSQKIKLSEIETIIKKLGSLDKQKIDLLYIIKELYNKYNNEAQNIITKLSDEVD
jgi:predicted transcriptional regulator